MRDFLSRVFCGVLLGISVVAPGVSGTIIAVSMGIYDRLIGIISSPLRGLRRNIGFVVPLGIGGAVGALGFLLIFKVLLEASEVGGYMLFIGLVLGSMPVVTRELRGFRPVCGVGCVLAFGLAVGMAFFAATAGDSGSHSLPALALCGAVAGAMSVIPGVSVSMTLMLLGVYTTLLNAVFAIDIAVICAVGASFVAGMVAFSNLIKLMFEKMRVTAFYMVFGFLAGSIVGVFVGLPHESASPGQSVLMLAAGIGLSAISMRAGKSLSRPGGKD